MNRSTVGMCDRIEYRLAAAWGTWRCARRRVEPGDELLGAREVASSAEPSAAALLAGTRFAVKTWWLFLAAAGAVLGVFGLSFDEFFYTRKNVVPYLVLSSLLAVTLGILTVVAVLGIRLRFLAHSASALLAGGPPRRRAFPKAYDFWLGVAVAAIAFPWNFFGVTYPIVQRG